MKTSKNGFTLLELMFAITITAIIAVSMLRAFQTAVSIWETGTKDLKRTQASQKTIPAITAELAFAEKIINLSLAEDKLGFIVFNKNNTSTAIFINSISNQEKFNATNLFDKNTLMIRHLSSATTPAEPLIKEVTQFNVMSYTEYSPNENDSFNEYQLKTTSPNNLSAPISTANITALRLKLHDETNAFREQFLALSKSLLESSNTFVLGEGNTFDTHTSLKEKTDTVQDHPLLNGDGVVLSFPNHKITIRNSGKFYETITEALEDASEYAEILISSGTYVENEQLILKKGIKLLGGYNPITWQRDPNNNPTTLQNKGGGIYDIIIVGDTDTVLDGLTIDNLGFSYTYHAENKDNIIISNCTFINTGTPIRLINSNATIKNNSLTCNNRCIQSLTSNSLSIYRNKLRSLKKDNIKANLLIQNGNDLLISNNLIIGGGNDVLKLVHSNPNVGNASIVNNIITGANGLAINSFNIDVALHNNFIIENNVGISIIPWPGNDNISFNIFGAQQEEGLNILGQNDLDLIQTGNQFFETGTWLPARHFLGDNFLLKPNADSIDQGNPNPQFNDIYFAQSSDPSRRTKQNDIGAYGGPLAGRVGPGITFLSPHESGFIRASETSWPGDILVLKNQSYLLPDFAIRHDVALSGVVDETKLIQTRSNAFITPDNNVLFENLIIKGNGKICIDQKKATIRLVGITFLNCLIGLSLESNTNTVIDFSTFFNNTSGIVAKNNAKLHLTNSIISNSISTGLANQGTAAISGTNNLFFNNLGSHFSGNNTLENNILDQDPLFIAPDTDTFYVHKNSPAIDSAGDPTIIDAGALPYVVQSGTFVTTTLSSKFNRQYKQIHIDLFGDFNEYPETYNARLAEITLGLRVKSQESEFIDVTTSPPFEIISNTKQRVTWSLPPTVITQELQVSVNIKSFQHGRSPFLNKLTLTW